MSPAGAIAEANVDVELPEEGHSLEFQVLPERRAALGSHPDPPHTLQEEDTVFGFVKAQVLAMAA